MGFTKFYISAIAILCADLTSYYMSITLAYFSRTILDIFAPDIVPFELGYVHFLELWWIPLIFLSFFAYEGLYTKRFLFWDEVKEILKTVALSGLVLFSLVSLAKISDQISRATLLFLLLYMGFLIPILRYFAKKYFCH